jgi:hypothetical protein
MISIYPAINRIGILICLSPFPHGGEYIRCAYRYIPTILLFQTRNIYSAYTTHTWTVCIILKIKGSDDGSQPGG